MTAPARPEVRGSLSPSRAADFVSCPLKYRLRTIDKLPEDGSPAAVRGTLVHAVLEALLSAPAAERTPAEAEALIHPMWQAIVTEAPEVAELLGPEDFAEAGALLRSYFELEDPRRLARPPMREVHVEGLLDAGLLLRGYIDRVDVAPTGDVRIVDYKTGKAPRAGFEASALFQLRFYGLVWWRTKGVVPRLLRLMYLGDRQVIDLAPTEDMLLATEARVLALWAAIERSKAAREFKPAPSKLCDWCSFHELCPAKGGTPPPWPEEA